MRREAGLPAVFTGDEAGGETMTWAIIFWVVLILFAVFGGYWSFRPNGDRTYFGGHLILCFLIGMLGWIVYGGIK